MAGAVSLLAALIVAPMRADERSLPIEAAVQAEESRMQLEELKMAFRKLMGDNAELQGELAEKEQALKALGESLAVAQSEAAVLKRQLQAAQLRAATPDGTPPDLAAQRQLADALTALKKSELERQRLTDELARLNAVLDQALHGKGGMSAIQRAQALAQAERVKRTLAGQQPAATQTVATNAPPVTPATAPGAPQPTLENGQVVNLNWSLQMAVINLGEVHGVRLGMPFAVIQGDRIVGHLKAVEVRKKISGAVIETMDRSKPIQVGDRVRITKSQ
ncbi:MAG: hypothetical protein HZA91_20430 [Verrucomicrobia bacterium]|nr:hypothetical protein [Verrucomicrobiota bacterium]